MTDSKPLDLIAELRDLRAALSVERIEAVLRDYEADIVADAQHDGRVNCATLAAVLLAALKGDSE